MNRKKVLLFLSISALVMMYSCKTGIDEPEKLKPSTKMDSISYIIGFDYGTGIREQEIKANPAMVYKGLVDGLKGDSSVFSDTVQQQLIDGFQKELEKIEAQRFQIMLEKNKEEGRIFLENNKSQEGVEELPDGLQYKVLKIGKGNFPVITDSVTIHYRAMYVNRTTFDMSYETGPVGIRLNQVIKGLSDGIQMMKPGSIFEFYIPSHLAYGDKNYMDMIPAGSAIIYSVELINIYK